MFLGIVTSYGQLIEPSLWQKNGTSIYYNLGNVGIGTSNPLNSLDINGNLSVNKAFIEEIFANHYNWSIKSSSNKWLSFDGQELDFNISQFNNTGDLRWINRNGDTLTSASFYYDDVTMQFDSDSSFFIYDIDDEIHHLDVDLERFDEMRSNCFTKPLDITTFHNSSGSYINISTEDGGKITFVLGDGITAESFKFDYSSIVLPLIEGTNSTPILNRVYVQKVGGVPQWVVSTTEPTTRYALASRINLGSDGFVYASLLQEDGTNGIFKKIQRGFRKKGLSYESGLDYNATATYLEIGDGKYISGVYDLSISAINSSDGIYLIDSSGNYIQYSDLPDLIANAKYSDGSSFGSNKYINIIFGITPYDGTGRLYAIIQLKPTNEYNSVLSAYVDAENTLKIYPSDDFLKLNFLPIARIIANTNSYEAQILPNGKYAIDYRGGIAGGISSGGGITEVDPVWSSDKINYFTKTEILNFNYYNSTDFNINDYYLKSNPFGFYNSTTLDLSNYVSYTGATNNLDLGNYNVTAKTGFFDYVGSLINEITKIFTKEIEISGKINLTNGTYNNQIYTDENGTLTFYIN